MMSRLQNIGNYGLWVAQYASMEPIGYQENPWNEGAYACVMRQILVEYGRQLYLGLQV